jgi:hypothetical protein
MAHPDAGSQGGDHETGAGRASLMKLGGGTKHPSRVVKRVEMVSIRRQRD